MEERRKTAAKETKHRLSTVCAIGKNTPDSTGKITSQK